MIIMTKLHIGNKIWHRHSDGSRNRYVIVGIDVNVRTEEKTTIHYHLKPEAADQCEMDTIIVPEHQLLASKQLSENA